MTPIAYLAAAILIEVAATTSLKYSDGFSRLWPSIATAVGYAASFALLAQALKLSGIVLIILGVVALHLG